MFNSQVNDDFLNFMIIFQSLYILGTFKDSTCEGLLYIFALARNELHNKVASWLFMVCFAHWSVHFTILRNTRKRGCEINDVICDFRAFSTLQGCRERMLER